MLADDALRIQPGQTSYGLLPTSANPQQSGQAGQAGQCQTRGLWNGVQDVFAHERIGVRRAQSPSNIGSAVRTGSIRPVTIEVGDFHRIKTSLSKRGGPVRRIPRRTVATIVVDDRHATNGKNGSVV